MDEDDHGEEVEFYMLQVADLERHVDALEIAVAVALTELNTFEIGWGRSTATNMIRQVIREWPVVQEVPTQERTRLRDRILPRLAQP